MIPSHPWVALVIEVCREADCIDRDAVSADLELTRSVEETIDRIFNGNFLVGTRRDPLRAIARQSQNKTLGEQLDIPSQKQKNQQHRLSPVIASPPLPLRKARQLNLDDEEALYSSSPDTVTVHTGENSSSSSSSSSYIHSTACSSSIISPLPTRRQNNATTTTARTTTTTTTTTIPQALSHDLIDEVICLDSDPEDHRVNSQPSFSKPCNIFDEGNNDIDRDSGESIIPKYGLRDQKQIHKQQKPKSVIVTCHGHDETPLFSSCSEDDDEEDHNDYKAASRGKKRGKKPLSAVTVYDLDNGDNDVCVSNYNIRGGAATREVGKRRKKTQEELALEMR